MAAFTDRRADGNDLLRAVIDTAVDGMVVIDHAGIIAIFNPAAETLFGYAADEVVGQAITMLMPAGDRQRHDGYMRNYAATGIRQIIGIGREVRGRRKDGTEFPLHLSVGEIKGGVEYAYVGVIRDITDEQRYIAALVEARAKAELASSAKSQFLARMSHELRTPMNAILGFAQLLRLAKANTLSPEKHADYIESIIGPGEHLAALIDDILDLTRIEAGGLGLKHESLNLADLVAAAVAMVQPLAQRFEISIFNRCLDNTAAPVVTADPVRLTQCVVNLLSNAVKYNRAGGRILVDLAGDRRSGGAVRLTVEDSGIGIQPARLDDVFLPFTRLHTALDSIEGAGIGLAVTRQLIEAMGGTVTVESEHGRGSRFHLDIPLAPILALAPVIALPLELPLAMADPVRPRYRRQRHARRASDRLPVPPSARL